MGYDDNECLFCYTHMCGNEHASFENECQFFNESDSITKNLFLSKNVNSILIHNFYRDLSTQNKNLFFDFSFFYFL
jgi:hypothetical protein